VREDADPSARDPVGTSDDEQAARRTVGTARLLPAVAFGLGTAVLAGVIVGAAPMPGAAHPVSARGAATVALGGAISELTGPPDTTCCG
jgi:hypothetical protein